MLTSMACYVNAETSTYKNHKCFWL